MLYNLMNKTYLIFLKGMLIGADKTPVKEVNIIDFTLKIK